MTGLLWNGHHPVRVRRYMYFVAFYGTTAVLASVFVWCIFPGSSLRSIGRKVCIGCRVIV